MAFECESCGREYDDDRDICDSDDCPGYMPIEEAIGIVVELAECQHLEDLGLATLDEMCDEVTRQRTALNVVHDFAVNQLGDD